MRVLYFTEGDTPHDRRFLGALGGTCHQVFALRRMPCKPEAIPGVIELGWPHGEEDWSDWHGWEVGVSHLKDILARVRPDVLHGGPIQGPALLAALADFHPLLTMSWGSDLLLYAKRSPWMRYATQFTLAYTDLLLADCQMVADEALRYGFLVENIIMFPWGVDLNHFSLENGADDGLSLRKTLGWEDKFVILCNRTWSPPYGVDVLVKAFTNAVHLNPNLRLLLGGDGPQRELIYRQLEPLGNRVHCPGWVDRAALPATYCAADLYVSPSHCDGSSVSLLEAMACSRPVLVSDIPSNCEWVKQGVNGDLFHDGEVDSLTDKLLNMPNDPCLMQFGSRSREITEEKANWNENFDSLLNAYQEAVNRYA